MGRLSEPPPQPRTALGQEGAVCESCRPFWENRGKPPQRLVAVPGKFTETGIPIVVCPWCDGTPILDMNR